MLSFVMRGFLKAAPPGREVFSININEGDDDCRDLNRTVLWCVML